MALTKASLIDLNGQELILDADADTSITADTDDQIDFKVGGTDRLTLSSDGKLKVTEIAHISSGTLEIGNGDEKQLFDATEESIEFQTADTERLRIVGNNLFLTGGTDARIQLGTGGAGAAQVSNNTVHIRGDGTDMKLMAASGGGYLFEENGTQVFQIDSSGRFGFGSLGAATSAQFMRVEAEFDTNRIMRMANRDNSGNGSTLEVGHADNNEGAHILLCYHGNNTSGASGDPYNDAVLSLQVNGNLAIDGSFSPNSDRRLKKDITNCSYGLDAINQLIPRTYKGRDVSKEMMGTQIGLIADEVEGIIPEVVSKFGLKADGSTLSKTIVGYGDEEGTEETFDEVKNISYERLVVVLTKALQEADDKIDALTARVTTLEGS